MRARGRQSVVQSIVRDDLVGHAEALGIGRGQLIAEQGELHGPAETHLPREQPTLAVIDGVTQFHLGQGEARRRREHRQVGCEDQCSAESDRVAARTYDQHLRQVQQAAHERLDARAHPVLERGRPASRVTGEQLLDVTDVGARTEVGALALHDDDVDVVVVRERDDGVAQLVEHRGRERILGAGTIEQDAGASTVSP